MRYACPKCGKVYMVKPLQGACTQCNATLVPETEGHEAEAHGEIDVPPKKKL